MRIGSFEWLRAAVAGRSRLFKRMAIMLAAMAAFVVAIGFFKFQQIQAAIKQGSSYQPPPEAVTTVVTEQDRWQATLKSVGSVVAVHGVTVSADLPGVVERISFQSGRAARAGQVLVQLDASQERAQLAAANAQRDLARLNLGRARGLLERAVISQAEFDRVDAEAKQADARVGEIRATIARKRIRAPFSGVLGIRQVNLGQYLTGGDPVVPLQSLNPIYVNFSVPQDDVGGLRPGAEVRVTLQEGGDVVRSGRITAVNSVVDEATRNVEVQATLTNPDGRLRPGMFVEAEVLTGAASPVVALPISAINYAPYGNSVFIVEPATAANAKTGRKVRQQFVKLGSSRGDQVAVTSGIKPGEEIVSSGVFKLRNGATVVVNNEIRPGNNPAPQPEDS